MRERGHYGKDLRSDLANMGIRTGDLLIAHASMKSIGWVRGGPATVVRAMQRAVGRRGGLVMPAFSYCVEKVYSRSAAFDLRASASQTGLLTETFRKTKGVVRSRHPTHSVAAWGRSAEALTVGHEKKSAMDIDTPFHRAALAGAKVCMIGCDFKALSLLHVAETIAVAPYLGIFGWGHRGDTPTALVARRGGRTERVSYPFIPGCSLSFERLQPVAERKELIQKAKLGNAPVLLFSAADVIDLAVDMLRRRPDFFLCPAGNCPTCDERRAALEMQQTPACAAIGEIITDIQREAGIRLAGSAGERKAAQMVAERMAAIGLANVAIQEFPFRAWRPGRSRVEVRRDGAWQEVPSAPCSHSPATGARGVRGEFANVESLADLAKVTDARSKIGVLWDGYGESAAEFRRLMNAGFKGLVYIDRRLVHGDLIAVGLPMQWTRHFKVPMATVPHPDAFRVFGQGPTMCRIVAGGRTTPATSVNVSGEIPGRERGVILVTAHHDSVFNSTAPDDNLSGVAAMLRIAGALAGRGKPRLTIRFCSFGAEEVLSEGARCYALESGGARGVKFVLNNDAMGARVGTTQIHVTGAPALAQWVKRYADRETMQFKILEEICPFSDQFAFNAAGIPSIWFFRPTCATGRHYYHTVRDSLAQMSFDVIARLAEFQAKLVRRLAFGRDLPFASRLRGKLRREAEAAAARWFGS